MIEDNDNNSANVDVRTVDAKSILDAYKANTFAFIGFTPIQDIVLNEVVNGSYGNFIINWQSGQIQLVTTWQPYGVMPDGNLIFATDDGNGNTVYYATDSTKLQHS